MPVHSQWVRSAFVSPLCPRRFGRCLRCRLQRSNCLILLARPKRFELLTPRFVVWCSIQLSYGRGLSMRGGLYSRVARCARVQVGRRDRADSAAKWAFVALGRTWAAIRSLFMRRIPRLVGLLVSGQPAPRAAAERRYAREAAAIPRTQVKCSSFGSCHRERLEPVARMREPCAMTLRLPVIDVSPLQAGNDSARRAVAEEIGAACRDLGFFYAAGHAISPATLDQLARASHRFFALTEAEKMQIAMARGGRAWRGFFLSVVNSPRESPTSRRGFISARSWARMMRASLRDFRCTARTSSPTPCPNFARRSPPSCMARSNRHT